MNEDSKKPSKPSKPDSSSRTPYFEVAKDTEGYHWCLWSTNGRRLATNIVPADHLKDAKKQIAQLVELFKKLEDVEIYVRADVKEEEEVPAPEPVAESEDSDIVTE